VAGQGQGQGQGREAEAGVGCGPVVLDPVPGPGPDGAPLPQQAQAREPLLGMGRAAWALRSAVHVLGVSVDYNYLVRGRVHGCMGPITGPRGWARGVGRGG
jgi:hypothetical protein